MSATVEGADECRAASRGLPATPIDGRYSLRFARTRGEVEAALRLRFEVFNLELHVDRERKTAVSKHLSSIASILETAIPVVLLPEGTSSDGSTVLPFRSSILQAAIISQAAITPAAISYDLQGGSVADEICYWRDMVFACHFWNLLGKPSLKATLRFGTPQAPAQGREQRTRLQPSDGRSATPRRELGA